MPATGLSFSSSTTTAILARARIDTHFQRACPGAASPADQLRQCVQPPVAVLSVMVAFRKRALDAVAVTQAKAVGLLNINMHFQHPHPLSPGPPRG